MARRRSTKPKKIIEPHSIDVNKLKAFGERIGRIDKQIVDLKEDRKQVLIEADAMGYHKKIINRVIADARRDAKTSPGEKECYELYRDVLSGTPLGEWAKKIKNGAPPEKAAAERKGANHKPWQTACADPGEPADDEPTEDEQPSGGMPPIPSSLRRGKKKPEAEKAGAS